MRLKTVTSTRPVVDIHPYIQGRLRALPRQEESAGILLGNSENGVTHITGFKRVPPNAFRQAAESAGPALAGYFRLQTPAAPTLLAEEIELCRQTQPLFLLLNAVNGAAAEATAWTQTDDGPPIVETISLSNERLPPPPSRVATATRPAWYKQWVPIGLIALGILTAIAAYSLWPSQPAPYISLDVQAKDGELAATWQQNGIPKQPLESASLILQDGDALQTMDITRTFTPSGRVVLHPRQRNIVVTLNVQFDGGPRLSRSATYVGFDPVVVNTVNSAKPPQAAPPPDAALLAEVASLRKRNKELLDAITAMRKHFEQ